MIMMSGERPDYHYLLTHLTPHWQAWPFARLLLRHFTTDTSSVKPREIFILHNKRFSDETLHEMLPICAGKGWQVISSLKTSLKPSSTFWTPWTCKRSHREEISTYIYLFVWTRRPTWNVACLRLQVAKISSKLCASHLWAVRQSNIGTEAVSGWYLRSQSVLSHVHGGSAWFFSNWASYGIGAPDPLHCLLCRLHCGPTLQTRSLTSCSFFTLIYHSILW